MIMQALKYAAIALVLSASGAVLVNDEPQGAPNLMFEISDESMGSIMHPLEASHGSL